MRTGKSLCLYYHIYPIDVINTMTLSTMGMFIKNKDDKKVRSLQSDLYHLLNEVCPEFINLGTISSRRCYFIKGER